jgi:hypothetical protein
MEAVFDPVDHEYEFPPDAVSTVEPFSQKNKFPPITAVGGVSTETLTDFTVEHPEGFAVTVTEYKPGATFASVETRGNAPDFVSVKPVDHKKVVLVPPYWVTVAFAVPFPQKARESMVTFGAGSVNDTEPVFVQPPTKVTVTA